MQEKVTESTKVLDQELKMFKQQKEMELKSMISEFVRIQKVANEKLKNQWGNFLSGAEVSKEAQNIDNSSLFNSK